MFHNYVAVLKVGSMDTMKCYHCGDNTSINWLKHDHHDFCCQGCVGVYRLLKESNLDTFYRFEDKPGVKPSEVSEGKYNFLSVPEIAQRFVKFESEDKVQVKLFLPAIHCASCIYLLENLGKINDGIVSCNVSFVNREAHILFNPDLISFEQLAELLDRIGYAPNFELNRKEKHLVDKRLFYKLGLAGFAFGSIMLWSFPEYLGIDGDDPTVRNFMAYLCFAISVPVLFYSASDYLVSAYKAVRLRNINLDVPISLGIIALYAQSTYAIFSGMGAGYMDSFAAFVFFLLVGKWFQSKTYQALSFERDYTAYFPLAANRIQEDGTLSVVLIEQLEVGQQIELKNGEIIPCDAELLSERTSIDYSFVTGESDLVTKQKGDFVYAGGKVAGEKIRLIIKQTVDRSHLTSLWNNASVDEEVNLFSGKLSSWFLYVVLVISFIAAIVWYFIDSSRVVEIVVAILIVACPCALALSAPFTYGNAMRLLGRHGFYLKNVGVSKRFIDITDVVFDKTGTLTKLTNQVEWEGVTLSDDEWNAILQAVSNSNHPLNKAVLLQFGHLRTEEVVFSSFEELQGKGMQFQWNKQMFIMGSKAFVNVLYEDANTCIVIQKEGQTLGRFVFHSVLRPAIPRVVEQLKKQYHFHVLSGDGDKDQEWLAQALGSEIQFAFNQTPQDKKEYIRKLQSEGRHVVMVGDGLNDIGALGQADVGISVADDVFQFTPAADAVLNTSEIEKLPTFLDMGRFTRKVLRVCFGFSLTYNSIGLFFALSGWMEPIIAAIIMPLSSITVVSVSTLGVMYFSPLNRKNKL